MEDTIGNVVLNYANYSGTDLYSDGAVEDELLDIVKTYEIKEFNKVIEERPKWPILYHLSNVRGNIVDWLPITNDDEVLEIGAGCGAITGTLASMAKHVTCIELSKKRSLINAYRNKDKDNIDILVGNFEDVEKTLTKQYDYITLIGVFEYAASYISSGNQYVDFLNIIKRHLKHNGKLVIAIENKLGLKYWAGCQEDHVGGYFTGIEGYSNSKGVKTFSKKELIRLFNEAGLLSYKFYYPYPDYKLPTVIYSDKYLPSKGELIGNVNNFDKNRINLFNEEKVFNTIIDNGLFDIYANSYLVVLKKEGSN